MIESLSDFARGSEHSRSCALAGSRPSCWLAIHALTSEYPPLSPVDTHILLLLSFRSMKYRIMRSGIWDSVRRAGEAGARVSGLSADHYVLPARPVQVSRGTLSSSHPASRAESHLKPAPKLPRRATPSTDSTFSLSLGRRLPVVCLPHLPPLDISVCTIDSYATCTSPSLKILAMLSSTRRMR